MNIYVTTVSTTLMVDPWYDPWLDLGSARINIMKSAQIDKMAVNI